MNRYPDLQVEETLERTAEEQIVEAAHNGDAESFGTLYERCYAAMGAFELSEPLKKQIGTDGADISGHITDINSTSPDSDKVGPYESGRFTIAMSLQGSNDGVYSTLYLPEGKYQIDYELRPLDTRSRTVTDPVHKGTVTVELKTGQTSTIALSERPAPRLDGVARISSLVSCVPSGYNRSDCRRMGCLFAQPTATSVRSLTKAKC